MRLEFFMERINLTEFFKLKYWILKWYVSGEQQSSVNSPILSIKLLIAPECSFSD